MKGFQYAAGTVQGTDHLRIGRNNQDAYFVKQGPEFLIAVVSDGCSGGESSEVGAKLTVRFVSQAVDENLGFLPEGLQEEEVTVFLKKVYTTLLEKLDFLTKNMSEERQVVANDFFLATTLSVIITPVITVVFSMGDGVIYLNDEPIMIGPFKDNMPPYPAYALFDVDTLVSPGIAQDNFVLNAVVRTEEVRNILIGTDGMHDYISQEEACLPGKQEKVGNVSGLWTEDRYFKNWVLSRRFSLLNQEYIKPLWNEHRLMREKGLLEDDTTCVVIRRSEGVGDEDPLQRQGHGNILPQASC